MHVLAAIPSPTRSVWHLGPLPLRAYALCIVAGIVLAVWLTSRRWKERGGEPDHVWDIATWAVILGIIGARVYHVVTDPELYFDPGKHPIDVFKIYDGGLGIWGAVAFGYLGAWIACRRRNIRVTVFADAAVPGIIFAQALGRLGNWFNNELYGRMTDLPWGLTIHCIPIGVGHPVPGAASGDGDFCPATSGTLPGHYQPTFLYELIWDVAVGVALLLLDRRLRLGRGNVMALYVMGYTAGRVWIEYLRIDHANHILGVRLNVWTSIIVFLGGLAWFLTHGGFRAQREASPYKAPPGTPPGTAPGDHLPGDHLPGDDPSDGGPPGGSDAAGREEVAADAEPDR